MQDRLDVGLVAFRDVALVEARVLGPGEVRLVNVTVRVADGRLQHLIRIVHQLNQGNGDWSQHLETLLVRILQQVLVNLTEVANDEAISGALEVVQAQKAQQSLEMFPQIRFEFGETIPHDFESAELNMSINCFYLV